MKRARSAGALRAVVALVLVALRPGVTQGAQSPNTQTFSIEPGAVLRVSNPRGAIRIQGWARPEVELRIHRVSGRVSGRASGRASEASHAKSPPVDVERSAALVEIRAPSGQSGLEYEVRVPAATPLERVASTSGSIVLVGMRGDARIETTSGRIRLESVEGSVRATTSSGAIEAVDLSGSIVLASSTGRIAVERARGVLTARSVSGSVSVRGAENVTAGSTSSSVTISGARGRVAATSTSGSVRLEDIASKDVEARSVSATVHYRGTVERGARYEFESFSGGVEIDLPAENCGFTLVAKTFSGAIETDFEVQLNNLQGHNTRRIEGVHGAGCARIVATSFSGGVVLRRVAAGAGKARN